ncbi:hypothetical protein BASA60_002490 [Batrachochytrium salamandrivorans]|nr:hypothetical protein BASA60_002490 [Batrachochytrium salamandrivorans]
MRLSTGIILSMLSANAFAIEHLNDAYSGSLLARRAVVADTDSPSLQKRNDGKEQEAQAKTKLLFLTLTLSKRRIPTKILPLKMIPIQTPTLALALEMTPQIYVPISSIKVVGLRMKGKMSTQALFLTKRGRALLMPLKALPLKPLIISRRSKSYRIMCKDPVKSPFILEFPFAISDESKTKYKSLQNEVLKSIENHILTVKNTIKLIIDDPTNVILYLEKMLSSADGLHISISNMKSEHSSLLASLGISGYRHLADLDMHIQAVKMYKCKLFEYFSNIKGLIGNSLRPLKRKGPLYSSPSMLGFKECSEIENKLSEGGASGSAQPNVAVVYNLVDL